MSLIILYKMRKYILILFLFSNLIIYPQGPNFQFSFLPPSLHFMPLKANFQEARIGILYFPDNANLKIDIGNNIDLLGFSWKQEQIKLTFGIEFMAYALSTSFHGSRLQIDALDGFFGGNASLSKVIDNNALQMRFRIIHNSAHFVDGHYDVVKKEWMNNTEPIPFTRDFGEFTIANKLTGTNYLLRYYGSIAYSTLVRPSTIEKYSFAAGFELSSNKILGKVFSKETNLFCAYHLNIHGIPNYVADNHLILGIKFGDWDCKGVVFYLSYFTGNNYFGEYYYQKIKKIGIGFFIDFI